MARAADDIRTIFFDDFAKYFTADCFDSCCGFGLDDWFFVFLYSRALCLCDVFRARAVCFGGKGWVRRIVAIDRSDAGVSLADHRQMIVMFLVLIVISILFAFVAGFFERAMSSEVLFWSAKGAELFGNTIGYGIAAVFVAMVYARQRADRRGMGLDGDAFGPAAAGQQISRRETDAGNRRAPVPVLNQSQAKTFDRSSTPSPSLISRRRA